MSLAYAHHVLCPPHFTYRPATEAVGAIDRPGRVDENGERRQALTLIGRDTVGRGERHDNDLGITEL
jgi:hypothetical protein